MNVLRSRLSDIAPQIWIVERRCVSVEIRLRTTFAVTTWQTACGASFSTSFSCGIVTPK
jgi:hypothetical protein